MHNNSLFKKVKIDYINEENDLVEIHDIQEKNHCITNYLDDILEHPFIDSLESNTYPCNGSLVNLVLYRINRFNEFDFVEYYLLNGQFLSIILSHDSKKDIESIPLLGKKRLKGGLMLNGENYLMIQVMNTNDNIGWITIWDVIVNESVYGEKIQQREMLFFRENNTMSNLIIKNKVVSKPIILYCLVDDKYLNYIQNTNTVQFCQDKHTNLITLGDYIENDNVRNICFVDDCDLKYDISNELNISDYIILKGSTIKWIFKDDKKIISYAT
jgi:hypothetical protein|tara:strand:+ start:688 stop:1500 length:813 start_codon:yes stop_codon:yes gene_type:complete